MLANEESDPIGIGSFFIMNEVLLELFGGYAVTFLIIYAAALPLKGELLRETLSAALICLANADIETVSPIIYKLSLTVAALLIVKKELRFTEFSKLSVNFIIVYLAVYGADYFRENYTAVSDEWGYVVRGIVPALFALMYDAGKRLSSEKFTYTVGFLTERGEIKFKGYLDTGNRLYEGGEPVIVISGRAAEKLALKPDGSIFVKTVAGIKQLPSLRAEYKIYYDKNKHKLYSTPVVISDKIGFGQDVLLHADMLSAQKEDKCLNYLNGSKSF